jgi:hypothetical protein
MMPIDYVFVLRLAGAVCGLYAVWYFRLVLFQPARFLRHVDIDRPVVDPQSYTPRWRYRTARNFQIALLFIGTFFLSYAAAEAITWFVPDQPNFLFEGTASPRTAVTAFLALFVWAGLLSIPRKLAMRSACFDGHLNILDDATKHIVRWSSALEAVDERRSTDEIRGRLISAQDRIEKSSSTSEKFTREIEKEFWAELVISLDAHRRPKDRY